MNKIFCCLCEFISEVEAKQVMFCYKCEVYILCQECRRKILRKEILIYASQVREKHNCKEHGSVELV